MTLKAIEKLNFLSLVMKKFTIVCDFQGGAKAPFDFYVGTPEPEHHPIQFQAGWLGSAKGGTPPADIMESLQKLYTLSKENNMDFEELCFYAMSTANQDKSEQEIPDPADEEQNSEQDDSEQEGEYEEEGEEEQNS